METLSPNLPPLILIVDDDKEDQFLIQEGFEAGEITKRFHTVSDGAEAMEYLFRMGRYAPPVEAPRPDLTFSTSTCRVLPGGNCSPM